MREMIAVSIDYLTSSDCAVAFKRIAIFPDCMISLWCISWTVALKIVPGQKFTWIIWYY